MLEQRKREEVSEVCPHGTEAFGKPGPGPFHNFVREVREHPKKPDLSQDRMACTNCGAVLYDWVSFKA